MSSQCVFFDVRAELFMLIFFFSVELCLTSNVKGNTVPCYSKHHFKYWYELGHPTVICVSLLLFNVFFFLNLIRLNSCIVFILHEPSATAELVLARLLFKPSFILIGCSSQRQGLDSRWVELLWEPSRGKKLNRSFQSSLKSELRGVACTYYFCHV